MKDKIAIIGANEAITTLIVKAKEIGYETHVFAWECGDPGEKEADYFYPYSIDEKEKILEKCKEIGVRGVCSITSDYAAPTVNYVALHLGLICNSSDTDILARNKFEMRCAFKKANIYTPMFCVVEKNSILEELPIMKYPVIVKPTDRWSSKGITRVNCKEELQEAVKCAISESFDGKAIIEEYMEGPEYSAECICYRGNSRVLAFTQKQTTGHPHYIETGHIQPTDFSIETQEYISNIIHKALRALGIVNGAAHVEFKVLDDGNIGIIEIGARMGGGCIGTDLTPTSTGMDYVRMVIDIACGKEPDFTRVSEPKKVAIKFIMDESDLLELEQLQKERPQVIIRSRIYNRDFSKEVTDNNARHGYYIVNMEMM